jgi:hypothetical protein
MVPGTVSTPIKWQEYEDELSHLSSTEVRSKWKFTSSHNLTFVINFMV